MKQSLGLVEISGLSTAIIVADAMVKSANVKILDLENTRGRGYTTIKVVGDVGAVTAAVNVGKQMGIENNQLVSSKVIARPSDYIEKFFCHKKEEKIKVPKKEDPKKEIIEIKEVEVIAGVKEEIKEEIKPKVEAIGEKTDTKVKEEEKTSVEKLNTKTSTEKKKKSTKDKK
ncbi:MAG: BMC domain-containing protein [Lachnospirales bacterium]